ncbi:MAG: hypothetical protein ABR599_10090 [Gemmatimonadota bacterium]
MRFTRPPRLGKWGATLGAWTLIAILFSGQWIAMLAARGEPFTWKVVFFNFSDSYTWALLTPAILWLGRRFPLDRHTWRRSLAVHVPAGVAITLAQLLMVVWVDRLVAGSMSEEPASFAQTLFLYSSRRFAFGIVTYWVVLGVGLAIDYYRLFRERELRASQLEARLARSQLQVLEGGGGQEERRQPEGPEQTMFDHTTYLHSGSRTSLARCERAATPRLGTRGAAADFSA